MTSARFCSLLIVSLFAAACGTACAIENASTPEEPASTYDVTISAGRDDVDSDYAMQYGELLIDIFSGTGIGSVEVEIPFGSRPDSIVLRMHLSGLEQLQLAYDDRLVELSLASIAPHSARQSVIDQDGASEISSSSPYWMDVTIVPSAGDPAEIPLKNGYIEVALPKDFVEGGYGTFDLRWIDFYR